MSIKYSNELENGQSPDVSWLIDKPWDIHWVWRFLGAAIYADIILGIYGYRD
jgi:hypothetical protein